MRALIGVGNALRGDDAAGLLAVRRLRGALAPDVEVVEREGDPSTLIEAWAEAAGAVVVDAVRSGAPAGTVHRLDARAGSLERAGVRPASTHAVGLGEAIELARALDRLPPRLEVYGIEGERFDTGGEPSPAVRRAVDEVVRELAARLGPGTSPG